MDPITVDSWEDFRTALAKIRTQLQARNSDASYQPTLLFRGQSNSEWKLQSTLERYTNKTISVVEYFRKVARVQNRIETFTGKSWLFDFNAAAKWAESLPIGTIPGYELLTYLRHHGFPSPLLDWTGSPQIAAFFAFRDTAPSVTAVSVYAFCDYIGGRGRTSGSSYPSIHRYGPDVRGHTRHFLQKSEYTICTMFGPDQVQYFVPHQDAVSTGGINEELDQDWVWKIDIPASERVKALSHLGEYNLTAFSLFGSIESLAETLAIEEFGSFS